MIGIGGRDLLRRLFGWTLLIICGATVGHRTAVATDGPLSVPLIKQEYPGHPPFIRMVYLRVLALGGNRIDQPLIFDTGSAGVTIACEIVLPPALCSPEGIMIDRELELNGLRVTTKRAVSQYGTYDEYGNIAFAQMHFGSDANPVSTRTMPILVRYRQVRRSTGEIVSGPMWPKGIFGVAPVGQQADGQLRSPIDFVDIGPSLHRGFYLSPLGFLWTKCTIEANDCPEVDALNIGLDEETRNSFALLPLKSEGSKHFYPFTGACLSIEQEKICRPTLFDTANSTIMVAVDGPGGRTSLPEGVDISLDMPGVTPWAFKTTYTPEVEFTPASDINIIGIRYFEQNSLLIDIETKELGLRIRR